MEPRYARSSRRRRTPLPADLPRVPLRDPRAQVDARRAPTVDAGALLGPRRLAKRRAARLRATARRRLRRIADRLRHDRRADASRRSRGQARADGARATLAERAAASLRP